MIVKIDKLSHEMRGIAKIDNKVTFVDKVIPNEVVNIRITKQKKKINEAKLVSIIEKSPNRIEPKCKYYNRIVGKGFDNLTNFQKDIIQRVCCQFAEFKFENADGAPIRAIAMID